jgi:hypothetical protein
MPFTHLVLTLRPMFIMTGCDITSK